MAPRKSPRDSQCKHCGRYFTAGGLRQHLRHVKCSPTSTATPRKFKRVRCRHCGASFHSTNSLRVHVSTRHAKEYAKSPGSMKDHRAPYSRKDSGKSGGHTRTDRKTSSHANAHNHSSLSPRREPRVDIRANPTATDRRSLPHSNAHRSASPRHEPAVANGNVVNHRDSGAVLKRGHAPTDATTWQRDLERKLAEAADGQRLHQRRTVL